MDGFHRDDSVLVIGATNLSSALDDALLRPGRFDRTIHMGRPAPTNRLRILQVHAKGKPIDRSDDDALLRQVADLAIGYSGAELANLLNEAAILAVRKDSPTIDLDVLKQAMDKVRLGLPHASLPDSLAKRRFAAIEASRAVAFALTPGMPQLEHVTIRPRGGAQARILFVPQEPRSDGGTWHLLAAEGARVNDVSIEEPLSAFELCCSLMTPLYVARCCEEIMFGSGNESLLTAKEISKAGELAKWIVIDSKLHPSNRDSPVLTNMAMGGQRDPTTAWQDTRHDEDILELQEGAYRRARKLVFEHRSVIERVAAELCDNSDETVLGSCIVELLQSTAKGEVPVDEAKDAESWIEGESILGELVSSPDMKQLVEVLMGKVNSWDLIPGSVVKQKAVQVKAQLLDSEERRRVETVVQFSASQDMSRFPEKPKVPEDKGKGLEGWMPPPEEVITL